jgi:Protein of unknown function (DUF2934)
MDEELKRRIRARARELWEADGRPEGRDMDYWTKAEEELLPHSVEGKRGPDGSVLPRRVGNIGEERSILAYKPPDRMGRRG